MSQLPRVLSSERMHRTLTAPRQHLVRVLVCWGGLCSLAVATGWWGRVASVHATLVETRDAALSLEQQVSAHRPEDLLPSPSSLRAEVQGRRLDVAEDDVSALVRWHALLQAQGLRDWQGRSVTAATPLSGDGSIRGAEGVAGGGLVWRLEGLATYEQGVSLLQAMVRQFPRLVFLQVQVHLPGQGQQQQQQQQQHIADAEWLQWHLELRWSAPLPALAQRWPAGTQPASDRLVNPFAVNRLPSGSRSPVALDVSPRQADASHVLPRAALSDIRLVGVLAQGEDRMALVTWAAAPTDPGSVAGRAAAPTSPHRLRLGQVLGVEQAQVVAIQPQAVVLEAMRQASSGQKSGRRAVLAWTDTSPTHAAGEGSGP